MSNLIINVSSDSYEKDVLQSPVPVLVDFWAPWCSPCRAIAPLLEKIAPQFQGQLQIAKINVDDNRDLAGQLGIRNIPTLLLFKDGKQVDQLVGLTNADLLVEFINKNIV